MRRPEMKLVLLLLTLALCPAAYLSHRGSTGRTKSFSHKKKHLKHPKHHEPTKKDHKIRTPSKTHSAKKSRKLKAKVTKRHAATKPKQVKSRKMPLSKVKRTMLKSGMWRGLKVHPKSWKGAGSKKEIASMVKKQGYDIKTMKLKEVLKLKISKKNKERVLWWGWWNYRSKYYNLQHSIYMARVHEWWRMYQLNNQRWWRGVIRGWTDYWRRWSRYWHETLRQHRTKQKLREQNMMIDVQRSKIRQMDRRKFDLMMMKSRKLDSKNFTRTFIYDAIMLTEKMLYIEHDAMFTKHNDAGGKHEVLEVKKLDNFFSENFKKKNGQLSPEDLETDIFMDY